MNDNTTTLLDRLNTMSEPDAHDLLWRMARAGSGYGFQDIQEYGITIDGLTVRVAGQDYLAKAMSTVIHGNAGSIQEIVRRHAEKAVELPMEDGEVGPRIWELKDRLDTPIWFEEFAPGELSVFLRSER